MATDTPTISEQAQALASGSAAAMRADIMGAFAADQAALDAGGVPHSVVAPGSVMPDGYLLDLNGGATSLTRLRAGRPTVVVFYRGAWCPYCNIALRTYQAELVPALAERGIDLVAISPQAPDGSLSTKESKELTFTVLSDPGNQIAQQLGILTAPSDGTRAGQLQLGLDLAQVNA